MEENPASGESGEPPPTEPAAPPPISAEGLSSNGIAGAASGGSPIDRLRAKPGEIRRWWANLTAVFDVNFLVLIASVYFLQVRRRCRRCRRWHASSANVLSPALSSVCSEPVFRQRRPHCP